MSSESWDLVERLARMETKLDSLIAAFDSRIGDHENRLRKIESQNVGDESQRVIDHEDRIRILEHQSIGNEAVDKWKAGVGLAIVLSVLTAIAQIAGVWL